MDFSLIIPTIIEWWPLFFAAAVLWSIGQQVKKFIPDTQSKFWVFYKRTLPLHPVLAGILFGSLSFAPVPTSVASLGGASGSLFYAGAGFLATYGHDLWVTWRKHRNKSE